MMTTTTTMTTTTARMPCQAETQCKQLTSLFEAQKDAP